MDHNVTIDKLTSLKILREEEFEAIKLEEPSEEEIINMKYRKGQKLVDTATGKEVTIIAGRRASYKIPGP